MLHLAVNAGFNAATIDVRLQPLYKLCCRLSRSSVAWKKFKQRQQEVVGGVHSESEGEGKGECEGNANAADRGALRLHAPVKIRWNSVFDCINKALQLKTPSQGSQRMTWNWMAALTVKTMKIRQMGKLAESSKKWCAQHIPILCCSFIYIAKVCVFVVFVVLHVAGVWEYFQP